MGVGVRGLYNIGRWGGLSGYIFSDILFPKCSVIFEFYIDFGGLGPIPLDAARNSVQKLAGNSPISLTATHFGSLYYFRVQVLSGWVQVLSGWLQVLSRWVLVLSGWVLVLSGWVLVLS